MRSNLESQMRLSQPGVRPRRSLLLADSCTYFDPASRNDWSSRFLQTNWLSQQASFNLPLVHRLLAHRETEAIL